MILAESLTTNKTEFPDSDLVHTNRLYQMALPDFVL